MARVMVVDDDEYVGLLFREELEAEGYEVELVREPEDVLRHVSRSHPDLLVLDLSLGESDGRDMLAQLRESFPELPVVVCSGYDLTASEVRELSAVFVTKSFDLGPLKETISELLKRRIQ